VLATEDPKRKLKIILSVASGAAIGVALFAALLAFFPYKD
jgi:hypothetical protein